MIPGKRCRLCNRRTDPQGEGWDEACPAGDKADSTCANAIDNPAWRASEDRIRTTDHPAVALHHAVNLASRADNGRRRYITTHVTGDAMSVLDKCGWKLVRKEESDE